MSSINLVDPAFGAFGAWHRLRVVDADSLTNIGGIVWLGTGAVVFIINKLRGRGVPQLAEEPAVPSESGSPVTATPSGGLR